MALDLPGPLVSAGWLAEHLEDADLRVVDIRWHLVGRPGRDEFLEGHVPGAVFVDLEGEITGRRGAGRHPLPEREEFQAAMRRAGVSAGTGVVAYDDEGGSIAARLWFLLRAFGHPRVAVLDGGVQAWAGPLEPGAGTPPAPGDFTAREPDWSAVVDFEGTAGRSPDDVLLDARAPERYRGEVEPVDPQAGHVPGARSAWWQQNLGPDGRFLSPERLRERFAALGVARGPQAIAYCGSGVTSCHHLLALEVAGLPGGRLYAGSWSDWSSRPGAPVATGAEP